MHESMSPSENSEHRIKILNYNITYKIIKLFKRIQMYYFLEEVIVGRAFVIIKTRFESVDTMKKLVSCGHHKTISYV